MKYHAKITGLEKPCMKVKYRVCLQVFQAKRVL
jgi:hypothetical protein